MVVVCVLVKTVKAVGQNNILMFIVPSAMADLAMSRGVYTSK